MLLKLPTTFTTINIYPRGEVIVSYKSLCFKIFFDTKEIDEMKEGKEGEKISNTHKITKQI